MGKTLVLSAKCGLVCLLIIAAALSETSRVAAQSGDPSTLPLLSADGLQYVGGFRLPGETVNETSYAFGGQSVAFNPANNSLFVGSYYGAIAEVTIPTLVNSSDVNALPFARFLQPFADPTEGHMADIATMGVSVGGIMVYGNRLYGTASIFYDANNTQRVSHYSRSLQLNQPSFSGWSQVWETGHSGFVSGWMAAVPSEWQAKLGGPAITGQCCIPIVWRTSNGPAALAFNPAQIGQAAVSATPLLYYTLEHATLGPWEGSSPTYGSTTQINGVAVIAGTRTVLYVGRNGIGEMCYGNGTGNLSLVGTFGTDGERYCYDPTNSDKGQHAYPYRYQVWAYDLNDFAAVKAGTKQPWDVVPYGVWPLSFPTPEGTVRVGGVAYDAQRQLLYISQRGADPDGYSSRPVIHAFRLDATPGTNSSSSNSVSNVALTADKAAPQSVGTPITFSAQPTGGVAPYQYKWMVSDGVTSTIAVNWTTSNRFTWTPATANANYRVGVWVRSSGNTADVLEASASLAFPIAAATTSTATSVSLVANRVAPQAPMTAITWTATPVGGVAPHQYKFRVFDGAAWTTAANWSTTNSFVWTPSTANSNYRVEVWVRSAGNTADAAEALNTVNFPIEAATSTVAPVSSVSLTADKAEPQQTGTTIRWNATPSGGSGPLVYKWFVSDGTGWDMVADWNSSAAFVWSPTVANSRYKVRVWVKTAGNSGNQPEAAADKGFLITAPPATSITTPPPTVAPVSQVTLTSDKASPQPAGTQVTFTAQAVGGVGPYQYQWSEFDGQQWSVVTPWGSANTLRWSRNTPDPKYQVAVAARSAGSANTNGEATASMRFTLNNANGNGK